MNWRERIEARRKAWVRLLEEKPVDAMVQMRIDGHTISAIASSTGYPRVTVEGALSAYRLLGPWSADWRQRMRPAA